MEKSLQEIDEDDLLHQFDNRTEQVAAGSQRRRGVVFYVDQGDNTMDYVRWWIFAWRFIGLDIVDEAFDLILMTHPAIISKLPTDCEPVNNDWKINFTQPGFDISKFLPSITFNKASVYTDHILVLHTETKHMMLT